MKVNEPILSETEKQNPSLELGKATARLEAKRAEHDSKGAGMSQARSGGRG